MRYLEIELFLKLEKDVLYVNLPEYLSKGMNYQFLRSKESKQYHHKNKIKLYNYSFLTPIEEDKIYKKDKAYTLKIRFMDLNIVNIFFNSLGTIMNPYFTVLGKRYDFKEKDKDIRYLTTITPAIIKIKNNITLDMSTMDLNLVKERILRNTCRKYNMLNYDNIKPHDFVENVELLNRSSIGFNYKNALVIGNKYKIKIKPDELSQEMAFVILGVGLLEKNSLAFGFCV
ncbi:MULTISPECIES: CRISPR-associated protein Cas6 [unclassified Clostridioides]|uniref:CRISPR-associated protein Cas6 n=1 Tax=unclassified Clostridioides TaxID=2635829 RepID=UPI001D129509|nr:CRISPR-associated protein Cas6 [Clostridioides sp. ES-S-0145-01]MCC0682311.1 CRISPR-associated protein Cas6 [Clostridioides sp. ES-S-0005-03]MCC0705468.1 CRISPR-associated protein Cas6 [Clostridioides sp. ES-S-0190-01]UDN63973.1 CRISPR-associated protein Cas6 [Clostridioides sp. ES-W-0016-02]